MFKVKDKLILFKKFGNDDHQISVTEYLMMMIIIFLLFAFQSNSNYVNNKRRLIYNFHHDPHFIK